MNVKPLRLVFNKFYQDTSYYLNKKLRYSEPNRINSLAYDMTQIVLKNLPLCIQYYSYQKAGLLKRLFYRFFIKTSLENKIYAHFNVLGVAAGVGYVLLKMKEDLLEPVGTAWEDILRKVHDKGISISVSKNHDYQSGGVDNIASAGVHGLCTRLLDKTCRIYSLSFKGVKAQVKDEKLEDTLVDTINYAAYGIMILDKTWESWTDRLV